MSGLRVLSATGPVLVELETAGTRLGDKASENTDWIQDEADFRAWIAEVKSQALAVYRLAVAVEGMTPRAADVDEATAIQRAFYEAERAAEEEDNG